MEKSTYNMLVNLNADLRSLDKECHLTSTTGQAETVKSAVEDSKVETGPENGLFWSRRLDRYSTISTILNFQCETAREVP